MKESPHIKAYKITLLKLEILFQVDYDHDDGDDVDDDDDDDHDHCFRDDCDHGDDGVDDDDDDDNDYDKLNIDSDSNNEGL